MWETYLLPARGNFSLRKIVLSLLAVLLSALFMAIISSTVTHAADASWQDDGSVLYGGKTYRATSPIPTGVNVPQGSQVFVAKEENSPEASVLFIEPNTDTTKEMAVKVTEYTVNNTGEYTNPRPPTPITASLEAKPEAKNKTQCDVAGVGWIICVTSRFIANGMDNIFKIIAQYLEVKPISTDTSSGLYKAWAVALGIANLMFILAFLFIIYAHLTSYGMSNYDIKKMIPKLIVAAILVNISYYICSIAVDISNILGYSVQQALIDVRTSLPDPTGSLDFNWKNVTEFILSGGTIVAGAFAAKAAFLSGAAGGSISGLAFLLFPILVSGALAVLIALLILAARQALITVLIVVAPLAFVAYLLPNTEKWFEKWRDLFMTMLLVFPLFSLLFGGSQLASYIVIQNTDQISIVIFAMFIQVAPLVMTPFLVKFSGSLLGRLAGMVNDPKRGIVDRARGWATDKAEVQRAKGRIAASDPSGRGGTRYQRQAFRREKDRMNREMFKKVGDAHVDAAWHNDSRYSALHSSMGAAELRKKAGESGANRHFENQIMRKDSKNLQSYVGREMVNNEAIGQIQAARKAQYEESKSDNMLPNNMFATTSAESKAILRQQKIADGRTGAAESQQAKEYVKALSDSSTPAAAAAAAALRRQVGGIDPDGALKAEAKAKSAAYAAKADVIKQVQDASDIMPGKISEMRTMLDDAVAAGDTIRTRAAMNMLAQSSNVGVNELRDALTVHEPTMATKGMLDEVKQHTNAHPTINSDAEDIGSWSRSDDTLAARTAAPSTWSNLTATAFMKMKQSSQEAAIRSGGISDDTARQIIKDTNSKVNVKPGTLRDLRQKLGINVDGSEDETF